jgi:hypothetical protein
LAAVPNDNTNDNTRHANSDLSGVPQSFGQCGLAREAVHLHLLNLHREQPAVIVHVNRYLIAMKSSQPSAPAPLLFPL